MTHINQFIQQVMHIKDPDMLSHLNESMFNHPAVNLYWKDRSGKYIACNDTTGYMAGLASGNDMLGLTDFDVCWEPHARQYQHNDSLILNEKTAISIGVLITTHDGQTYNCLSYKSALKSRHGKIIGIAGMTVRLTQLEIPSNNLHISTDGLSPRQKQCLIYLTHGMTIKKISQKLNLSPRTVEHHINIVKEKLGFARITDLIMAATGISGDIA